MRQPKTLLLLCCALGISLTQPVAAAPSKSVTASKPSKQVAAKSANKTTAKTANATLAKNKGKFTASTAKSSGPTKTAAKTNTPRQPAKLNIAVRNPQKSNFRQVVATRSITQPGPAMDWSGPLSLGSSAALVLDSRTGESLYQKNASLVMPIASISKLMSAMVVLDAGLNMSEVVTIGPEDVDTLKNSHSRLPVGASMSRETALLLALMSSDNRATHTLARHYPGGVAAFVQEMNRKAQAIGMTDTRFEEPTGLNSNNVSTARDLARMVSAASRYSRIRELSTTAEARVQVGRREVTFHNSNALVGNPEWEIGLSKTGYISEAGRCLVMHTKVADRPVIMVLLDSVGKMTRVGDAVRIKRWMEQANLGGRDTRGA